MTRRFNTVGACHPDQHYVLDARERLPQIKSLVAQSGCFWVYGSRQTGKTTTMQLWAMELAKRGKYAAMVVSAASLAREGGDKGADDDAIAEDAFLYELREAAYCLPQECQPPDWGYQVAGQRIRSALATWADACPRPLVLFMDDIDGLAERSLTRLLHQLASGFNQRSRPFPQAIALMALQDINAMSVDSALETPGSIFHRMRTATLALQSFTLEEVANVYQKHTHATGQLFTLEAVDRAFELTHGQPWLVNAIAQYAIDQTEEPIEPHHIETAATDLLRHQSLHHAFPLDHLSVRLRQFQPILESVLADQILLNPTIQQVQAVVAVGLCRLDVAGGLVMANPLYQEVILRQLALPAIAAIGPLVPLELNVEGTVNINQVWAAWVTVWKTHGDALMQTVIYESIAPYVAVIAFFQRLTVSNGSLHATYGFKSQSMTLTMQMIMSGQSVGMMVQVMVWADGQPDPMDRGLAQLEQRISQTSDVSAYRSASSHASLIIIDRRRDRPSSQERTRLDSVTTSTGLSIVVIRG